MYRLERGGGGSKGFFFWGWDGGGMDHMVLGGETKGGLVVVEKGD